MEKDEFIKQQGEILQSMMVLIEKVSRGEFCDGITRKSIKNLKEKINNLYRSDEEYELVEAITDNLTYCQKLKIALALYDNMSMSLSELTRKTQGITASDRNTLLAYWQEQGFITIETSKVTVKNFRDTIHVLKPDDLLLSIYGQNTKYAQSLRLSLTAYGRIPCISLKTLDILGIDPNSQRISGWDFVPTVGMIHKTDIDRYYEICDKM